MADLAPRERDEFRRRPYHGPHRRRRLWVRLLRPFLAALLLVGVPAAVVGWILVSPRFEVRRFEVVGAERVEAAWVRERLAPLVGRHLLAVGLTEVEARLIAHPWIRDLGLRRLPPDRVEVEIVERQPAAVALVEGERRFVDRDGIDFAAYDPRLHAEPLVLVRGAEAKADVARAVDLARRWPEAGGAWAGDLLELEPAGDGSFAARAEKLPYTLLVRADNLNRSCARFTRFLPEVHRRYPRLDRVDLRFDTQIVIHPAAASRGREG